VTVSRLVLVKALHTAIWALLAACVVAIPIAAWLGWFGAALGLIGVVAVEVAVLALNAWQCPLRGVAGRYTADRRDGFDIFLPPWLAEHHADLRAAVRRRIAGDRRALVAAARVMRR
jgi:hypothetical protein